jgi:hypothetical protein
LKEVSCPGLIELKAARPKGHDLAGPVRRNLELLANLDQVAPAVHIDVLGEPLVLSSPAEHRLECLAQGLIVPFLFLPVPRALLLGLFLLAL